MILCKIIHVCKMFKSDGHHDLDLNAFQVYDAENDFLMSHFFRESQNSLSVLRLRNSL